MRGGGDRDRDGAARTCGRLRRRCAAGMSLSRDVERLDARQLRGDGTRDSGLDHWYLLLKDLAGRSR